ncbi:EpsG family protein [uncultured Lacticaseibacillus sp.]|uniref:EpsG family protein n=1 Tax=uncultured Lacticaseibacillus sp. TaxID=2775882 RepID=UPI002593680D|nr:EpsG family protein [uncultured Lacticaseibacillus sp.]
MDSKPTLSRKKFQIKVKTIKLLFVLMALVILTMIVVHPQDPLWARDRDNYELYAKYGFGYFDQYFSQGGYLSVISNEPLFISINGLLGYIFTPDTVVLILVGVGYFVTNFVISRENDYSILPVLMYLLLPQTLKNNVMQTRQGLAVAWYLFFLTQNNRFFKSFRFFSVFIHTGSAILIVADIFRSCMRKFNFRKGQMVVSFAVLSMIIAKVVPTLSQFVGDRRADEYDFLADSGVSGLAWIFWLFFFVIFFVISESDQYSDISLLGIIFYLSTYFNFDLSGRAFEFFVPVILLSLFRQKGSWEKYVLIFILMMYAAMGWYQNGGITGWLATT